jgi:hypothetical protein
MTGTPKSLGDAGRALWERMHDGIEYDASETETLRKACELEDTAAALAAALEGEPMVVTGSRGQSVPHPLLAELRMTRSEVARLLSRLRVIDEPDAVGGRKMTRSESGRRAAQARWARTG